MLAELFTWWVRQLRSLLPRRFARQAPDATIIAVDRYVDDPHAATGAILLRRGGAESQTAALDMSRPLAATPARALATGLRLPEEMVLHRDVSLPLAAERDLATVLNFQMDRLTPFDAKDVFWGVSSLRRDAARGTLLLTLIVVLRRPVEALLDALNSVNLKPSFLESPAGRIEFATTDGTNPRLRIALYGLCAALALLCLVIPVLRQQLALNTAAAQIAALAPARAEALQLRQRLAIASSGQAAITAAEQSGDTLQALAALTAALPDGTWLSDLTLKSGDLTIDGESSHAARLIAVMAGSPGFHDPKFIAPVTRAIDGSADLFSIHATVGP